VLQRSPAFTRSAAAHVQRRRADVEAALRIKVDRDEFSATIAGVRETANEMRARLATGEEDIRREKQRVDHMEAVVATKSGHEETENKLSTESEHRGSERLHSLGHRRAGQESQFAGAGADGEGAGPHQQHHVLARAPAAAFPAAALRP
jgi:hypothetical protein